MQNIKVENMQNRMGKPVVNQYIINQIVLYQNLLINNHLMLIHMVFYHYEPKLLYKKL